ncbi:hypothetical protein PMZ80_003551 [Knufia obscura]|uniref:Uncharacterized protein n=1 Tax=Knufia obscura TaxID=1635080 RepID=A0ABR0RVG5_9EURO|nr:hypothetical protein PMZ80_003551 [Knufia obscura]
MGNFDVKLLKRSIAQKRFHQSVRPLYGDHAWAKDLDIVNELGAHTGCVNALSWSTSGRLLASGSDDTYLNIWAYNADDQAKPFTLNTSVNTGHQANIFSVKFMPHSNDGTVVTCAGDSEVRIFDLEYGAGAQAATGASESTRSRRFNDFFGNCRWLTEANTNARVYRSHADRAKRIVTESSPHLFLTCSEDGEVRQWDLRQPSSAYPSPRGARSFGMRRSAHNEGSDVPPALISYKRYGLDLNTISCSKSQPHYIALGGAHAHCFLHDRRMLGRNVDDEQGRPVSLKPEAGSPDDDSMREATKCVRRFTPNNKRKMRPSDHGRNHITACKISDARPNELISSWSGDYVYSFDIVKGPDARDQEREQDSLHRTARLTNRAERKRKRTKGTQSSTSLGDGAQHGRRLRRVSDTQAENGQSALRIRFENGDTEEVGLDENGSVEESTLLTAHETLLSEAQKQSERIARALVNLRKTLFDFSGVLQSPVEGSSESVSELSRNMDSYTAALGQASALLPEIEQVMREWTYPNTTDEDEILLQNTLRRNRQSSWRFVQAVGCLSRAMGGRIQTLGPSEDPRLHQFETIKPAPLEADRITKESQFCYDFIKAITLWLNGGREAVLAGFKKPPELKGRSGRYPFDESTSLENLSEHLQNYLLPLARDDTPVIDLGTNQFERDELRQLFYDQKSAVQTFTRAMDRIEKLQMYQGTSDVQESSGGVQKRVMDKGAAARFWGEKVSRALLMDAADGVTFNFVNRAFGGLKVHITPDDETIDRLLDEAEEEEMFVDTEESISTEPTVTQSESTDVPRVTIEEAEEDEPLSQSIVQEEDEDSDNVPDESEDEDTESDSDDEATNLIMRPRRRLMSTRRALVNNDVDYTSHTKAYKGHCNTRTVKDVNYYGLDDEYVISGSDDGRFFIWDRKTTEIVSVLEGDQEVVNVIQGHPYEPMIACSGIDSTIKIFGPGGDNRERYDARHGENIARPPGGERHSSLGMVGRARRRRIAEDDNDVEEPGQVEDPKNDDPEYVARNGLKSRRVPMEKIYEITSQNNAERQRGVGDAFMTVSDLDNILLRAWLMSNAMVT